MKPFCLCLFVCALSVWAQPPAMPNLPDETVIATFSDGETMTFGQFKRIYAVLPQENQLQAVQNRAEFLRQWALMRKLARDAEAERLDLASPAKEGLEYYRYVVLSQAKMNTAAMLAVVLPSDVEKFYKDNQNRYSQARVKAIYIGFGGQKLTEATAKAKASQIAAQARGGADFVKLVHVHSDDAPSKARDGDFLTVRTSDNLPDAVRDAIFKLKEGEVSDPVRQPNGYYIFRAEKVEARPFAEVRDDIFAELKKKKYNEWLEKTSREATILFNSPQFLGAAPLDTTPRRK